MAVFGQVHQLQVAAFHAAQAAATGRRPARPARCSIAAAACGSPSRRCWANRKRPLGQVEQLAGAVLADHAGQFPAEQADVAAEETFIGGARPNGRRETGGCFHI